MVFKLKKCHVSDCLSDLLINKPPFSFSPHLHVYFMLLLNKTVSCPTGAIAETTGGSDRIESRLPPVDGVTS